MEWPGNKVVWDAKELKEAWYRNNSKFVRQDESREFGKPAKGNRPEMSFREIADELGLSTTKGVYKSYKAAMVKMRKGLKSAGIDAELLRPDPEHHHRSPTLDCIKV